VVSALPLRAARRYPNELVQLKPSERLDRSADGLYLLSRGSVDTAVRRALRRELARVLPERD
jgi:hypothetical protein